MFEALKFAYGNKIYHLDVRPGNIIVKVSSSRCKAMLSDWGCSVDDTAKSTLKKFRDCPPYAHDSLLGKFSAVTFKPGRDFVSLAYTLDHVAAGKITMPPQI
jgi:hypothetical protein